MPPTSNQTSSATAPEVPPSLTTNATESAIAEALIVVRKRKWVIIAFLLLGVVYSLYQAATQPILYYASGRIQVRTSNQMNGLSSIAGGGETQDLGTETLIITSETMLLNVAREMNLANNPEFMGPGPYRNINDPVVRASVVSRLTAALQVTVVSGTNMIRISCTTNKAQLAADIVNHVINDYQQRTFESRFASTQRATQWLSGQLDDLKQQVETSQQQLMDMQKRLGVLGFDASKPGTTQATASVEALSTAAIAAKVQRILAESKYRVVAGSDPDMLENNLAAEGINSALTQLRVDATTTRSQIAQLSVALGPKHPQILALQAHLREVDRETKQEESRIIAETKQALVAAQTNEAQTVAALEQQKDDAYRLRDDLVEYTLRQRDYETNRALYDQLLSKLRSASVQAGLNAPEIDIVDPAYKPLGPKITPRSSILTRNLLFALVIGIGIAFTLESLDTGIRSIAEVEQITQLPSLSVIPRVRRITSDGSGAMTVAQSNIGVLATSKSQFSEAFRSLRTALLLATTGHPPKIILITSSMPSEGKTTVSTNLAAILAQRETRVLLIDADLRRPNVHHRFGLNGRIGLSTILSGGATLEEGVKTVPEVPNLDVLPSGPVPPFPTEMLSSESMHHLLVRCCQIYTHVVVDSPPILSVTDGVILARQADAIVMVVRHGKSRRNTVRRARDLLVRSGAAVTGVVLNSVDINAPEYHGYYGYSGYSYSNIDSESWESNGSHANGRANAAAEKENEA